MPAGTEHADIEALHLTREESRAVLDHRLSRLKDLDDKAMWTMQMAFIVLGILASAVGIAGTAAVTGLSHAVSTSFGLGIFGLFLTLFVGIGTFSVSIFTPGIGESHRQEMGATGYTEREWLDVLLGEYDEWIQEMEGLTEENVKLVFWAQALLGSSLALLFIAITLLAIGA